MKKAMTRIFLAMLTVFFLASSAFAGVSGDVSISVILKGTEPPSRCLYLMMRADSTGPIPGSLTKDAESQLLTSIRVF